MLDGLFESDRQSHYRNKKTDDHMQTVISFFCFEDMPCNDDAWLSSYSVCLGVRLLCDVVESGNTVELYLLEELVCSTHASGDEAVGCNLVLLYEDVLHCVCASL